MGGACQGPCRSQGRAPLTGAQGAVWVSENQATGPGQKSQQGDGVSSPEQPILGKGEVVREPLNKPGSSAINLLLRLSLLGFPKALRDSRGLIQRFLSLGNIGVVCQPTILRPLSGLSRDIPRAIYSGLTLKKLLERRKRAAPLITLLVDTVLQRFPNRYSCCINLRKLNTRSRRHH